MAGHPQGCRRHKSRWHHLDRDPALGVEGSEQFLFLAPLLLPQVKTQVSPGNLQFKWFTNHLSMSCVGRSSHL